MTKVAIETPGLHHVTAIARDPGRNVAFYTRVLGLRLVKRTVNFDDPSVYHLYYGDETGTPGTVLTFFPFPEGGGGRPGVGQVAATAFVVPEGSLAYWTDRLAESNVAIGERTERFGRGVLPFEDPDGQPLELVEGESEVDPWTGGPVPETHAVRGFHAVTLHTTDPDATAAVLETLGYVETGREDDRVRYEPTSPRAGDGTSRAAAVDLLVEEGTRGRQGVGTVHHVAFRVPDAATQEAWRESLVESGLHVTPVKDRQYFRSIYFREPGGVLVEVATDGPGFTRDESVAELGTDLKLPAWLEEDRATIERQLPPLAREEAAD